jgi:2,3,4,5-tetrahydropyridine-2-carboxylate N-succinyltransferase
MDQIQKFIEEAYTNRELVHKNEYRDAILHVIEELDKGRLRVAQKEGNQWRVNEWVKKAVLLYFLVAEMQIMEMGPFEFYDKIPLKKNFKELGVRVVPPGTARYGSFLAPGVVLMPGYVNIGAYVDEGTMVDTHATVGSCAQVGKNVHLAGAARVGGVLEPPQAQPVIIEDNVFVGSAVSIMEGVIVREEAVLGAGVMLTASTRIIDVSGEQPVEYKGEIPARSVVIPGTFPKEFPAGTFQVRCALIIGKRKPSTDKKVSLNEALRQFNVAV